MLKQTPAHGSMKGGPWFTKSPEKPVRRTISTDEQEEIKYAFSTLDSGKTGYVTPRQLKVALRALGFGVKKADVIWLLEQHSGLQESEITPQTKIDLEAFSRAVVWKLQERNPEEDVRRAFQLFDVVGTGRIDLPSLRKVVRSLNMDISDAELTDMIQHFGSNGTVNEAEFSAMLGASDD